MTQFYKGSLFVHRNNANITCRISEIRNHEECYDICVYLDGEFLGKRLITHANMIKFYKKTHKYQIGQSIDIGDVKGVVVDYMDDNYGTIYTVEFRE